MTEIPATVLDLLRKNPDAMNVPGAMCTARGPQDYIGAVPAIAGTLFFANAHEAHVRDVISDCFDEYVGVFEPKLTWLFREDPPADGVSEPILAYSSTEPLAAMLARMEKDDPVSFHYTSGSSSRDAGPWEFQVVGLPAWRAEMGDWGLSGLKFSVPILDFERYRDKFVKLFVQFASKLNVAHGYAGYSLVLSALRYDENQAFEAVLAAKFRGFDAGNLVAGAANAHLGIKTVGWLTAINDEYLEKVGGELSLRDALDDEWFRLVRYDEGVVIQAGPEPEAAPVEAPPPARLVLPDMLLRPIRTPEVQLHYACASNEPRLIGPAAEDWLRRLDVGERLLDEYIARLRNEPKLPPNSTTIKMHR